MGDYLLTTESLKWNPPYIEGGNRAMIIGGNFNMKIALAGNPNSGKTTLYNALTGESEKVGNWAGVTVDKRESTLKKDFGKGEVAIIDLPGAYSISPYTSEESIASEFISNENADVIINIMDATHLNRSLFFTTQLLEFGKPVVIALNKIDLAKKNGISIDIAKLSEELKCPVIEAAIETGMGIDLLVQKALEVVGGEQKIFTDSGIADEARYKAVTELTSKVESRKTASNLETKQDKVDKILANKILGIPIFAVIIYCVFHISQTYVGPFLATFLGTYIEMFAGVVEGWVSGASPFLQSIITGAILDGVGAVVGFLPLIMVLYFLIALLEDSGYIARVAVVFNWIFKKFGLNGRSIIPMIIGMACAIPGVMASRTIKDERERSTTAMLAPFIPCGAKLPVIALFAGAFFSGAAWVSTLMFFMGIVLIILGALVVKKITGENNRNSFFIIELPHYKVPSIKKSFIATLRIGWAFIVKAGTLVLICNVVVSILSSYDFSLNSIDDASASSSMLAIISQPIAFLLIPLGFGTWQLAAAAVTGFIAKENVVGTLATVFAISNLIDTDALELIEGSAGGVVEVMGMTQVAALAYLMFNMYTPPCFAAIGAMNAEMPNKKWVFGALGMQLATGWIVAFLVYQVGSLIVYGTVGDGLVQGIIMAAIIISIFVYLMFGRNKTANKLQNA